MSSSTLSIPAPDLTQHAPRSLRTRLGGYAVLPRMLDKCRASLTGKLGEYHSNCPLDQQFFSFVGIDPELLRAEVARGRTDSEMLDWVRTHAKHPRTTWEIQAWSAYQNERRPDSDPGTTEFFSKTLAGLSRSRTDILTWADLLDLDDHVSFGGTA